MSDTNQEILKTLREVKANQELILAELGLAKQTKRFIRKDETKATKKAKQEEAKPPTIRELWKKAKASLQRRGKGQQFYVDLKEFTGGR